MLTGDNGILTQAQNAKIETIVAGVKEKLQLSKTEATMQKKDITPETLLAEGKVARTVQSGDDGKYYMYYALKDGAYDEMQGLGKGNAASLRDVFLIDDDLNLKYIASNGKEYGDELNNKILDDETEIRFSSPAFSAYVSNKAGVSEDEMKFKWMKDQTELTIDDPSIDSLADLVFFPNLKTLNLSNCTGITSMDGVENCSKLENLSVVHGANKMDYTAVSKLSNLTSFTRFGGTDFDNIIEALKLCSNLKNLSLLGNENIDMKKISVLTQLESLNLSRYNFQKIEVLNNLTKLKTLNLSANKLTTTKGIENLTNLTSLNLSSNQIETIEGIGNLTKLTTLYLNNNQISDITPLKENTASTYLDLRYNPSIDGERADYSEEELAAIDKIGEILNKNGQIQIDVDKIGLFTNYTTLNLSNQNLTTLDVLKDMTNLTSLSINNNQITLEDENSRNILKRMTKLKSLDISNNPLKDISAINSLKNLTDLGLGGVNDIDLSQIEDIISNVSLSVTTETFKTIVNCDSKKITSISFRSAAGITELPDLSKFTNLKSLSLFNNSSISNISVVSQITSLQQLNSSACSLHGRMIDFSKLKNLTNLNLWKNSLWSDELENLKVLKNNKNLYINLTNNSIIDATALLDLDSSTRIDLRGNINLSQDSKDKLKAKFGNNVSFDQ